MVEIWLKYINMKGQNMLGEHMRQTTQSMTLRGMYWEWFHDDKQIYFCKLQTILLKFYYCNIYYKSVTSTLTLKWSNMDSQQEVTSHTKSRIIMH